MTFAVVFVLACTLIAVVCAVACARMLQAMVARLKEFSDAALRDDGVTIPKAGRGR